MEHLLVEQLISSGMKIMRGRIIDMDVDGKILVDSEEGDAVPCDFLRTSAGPLPELYLRKPVLYVFDEIKMNGYILGVIQNYNLEKEKCDSSASGQDTSEFMVNAEDRIELKCGKSSLIMKKDGKIIVRGSNVVTRASETNKIKGSAVQIN